MPISMNLPSLRAKWEEVRQLYPWYKEMTGDNKDFNWEDVPLLTQDRLLPYYESDERTVPQDWNVYRTSGTSGNKRKAIYYDASDEEAYIQYKKEMFAELLKNYEVSRALSDMGTGHAEATAVQIFEELGLACESVPFGLPAAAHLIRIAEYRPDVLYTMPSLLDGMLRVAPPDFNWGVQCVILVGEPAPPAWRQRVAERLGITEQDIMDTLGSIEIGTIAYYDRSIERYVCMDDIIAEGVEPAAAGLPDVGLPAGEQLLVLTSLVRRRFPALRFVTYDVVRNLRVEEREGKQVTTFDAIVKRVGPELKHGEKISVYDIENAIFKHVRQAVVKVLVNGNKLQINITTTDGLNEEARTAVRDELHSTIPAIGAMIRGGLLEQMDVLFIGEDTDSASPEGTGKKPIKQKKLFVQQSSEGRDRG
ncbi:coenzyme F390 synthetase-like protein [Paenibacillus sp. JDR-2]|uniref:coenzyme F390 synthetase-like protein n=1 Tax=Paenibacillus sp. (strain JDR-2) TaxID=324057 RepID=UPI00016648F1|nr:coenzyme F390 synthetase-like protein [Paenibacillus sp. JDR-2]ACT03804.1 coenzyme F390 synthetase-like protein [Paenibacillus sp. JDR-2]